MNLLARTMFLIQRSQTQINRFTTIAIIQHCNSYATKATSTTQKTQQLTNPKFQKPTEPSSFPQRIKKQVESLTNFWPKPREIPYQSKVANFVNLIGHVSYPVQFDTNKDGKDLAFTVISLENDDGRNSLSIPVVFEGDLAHVVACHVKENDFVFVSGLLSAETMKVSFSDNFGKFHVVAENLNFVEGYKKVAVNKKTGQSFSGLKTPVKEVEQVVEVENDEEFSKQWKTALEDAKARTGLKIASVESVELKSEFKESPPQPVFESRNDELKLGKGFERSTESVGKKKDKNEVLDLWRDVVKNPLQWYDYRGHKANGLVKEKYPDFKQKGSGESLWMNSAPSWVLPGIQKLEFDVKEMSGAVRVVRMEAAAKGGEELRESGGGELRKSEGGEMRKSGGGELWKSLVEDPSKWWDNRTGKRNPRAPDFKHKETGEGVWVDKLPGWALAKLPPVQDNMQRS